MVSSESGSGSVKVLSFNNAGVNSLYSKRGFHAQKLIPQTGADVFGLQEVAKDAMPVFSGYAAVTGIWTGSEYLPVYYRSERFELIDSLSEGLSQDERDKLVYQGITYGPFNRGFSAVRLFDRNTKKTLVVINAHLGLGGSAPIHAQEIVVRTGNFRNRSDLVILIGDFNHDIRVFSNLIPPSGFIDSNCAVDLFPTKPNRIGTEKGSVIDYLFFAGAEASATQYRVEEEILSDHYAVSAMFRYDGGRCLLAD